MIGLEALCCPHCDAGLTLDGGTARCPARHAFDLARQGYLNLMSSPGLTGDTAAMVAARTDFLASGNYEPIRSALVKAVAGRAGLTVEIGAGTAYYLAGVVEAGDRCGLAVDASRYAARRAAKAHPRIGSIMADVWHGLPIQDAAAAVILDVFAPRNATEFARILAPDGILVLVTPNPAHLHELVDLLGLLTVDETKDDRIAATLGTVLTQSDSSTLEWPMHLDRSTIQHLVSMGPSAWHHAPATLDRLHSAPAQVTASVTLSTWRQRHHRR